VSETKCQRLTSQEWEKIEKARKQLWEEHDKIRREVNGYFSVNFNVRSIIYSTLPIYLFMVLISIINILLRTSASSLFDEFIVVITSFGYIATLFFLLIGILKMNKYNRSLKDLVKSTMKNRWQYNKHSIVELISWIKNRYPNLCKDDRLRLSLIEKEIEMLDKWTKEHIEALDRFRAEL